MRHGTWIVLLALVAAWGSACANQAQPLQPFQFQQMEDAELARLYPFVAEQKRELAAEVEKANLPSSISYEIATVAGPTSEKFVFVRAASALTCGTAGCSSNLYAVDATGNPKKVLDVHTQPNASAYLSDCPNDVSLIMYGGHGIHLAWAKWQLKDHGFTHVGSYPDVASIPICESALNALKQQGK
jgi:hypothetical protein